MPSEFPDPQARSERRPTLAEVARRAGVSEITASRALRGGASVGAATLERVLAAASELGYLRNRLAGALAGGISNQIAVILPSLSNAVFADLLRGLEARLEAEGYHPVLGISDYDPAREERLVRNLLSWQPAGLAIASAGLTAETRRLLTQADVPVVEMMDAEIEPIDMAVGIAQRASAKAMAYYLIGRGHRRFGYVGHDHARDLRAAIRFEGFREALAEAGARLERVQILEGASSAGLGREGTRRLLAEGAAPQAIYYSNDDMAAGGLFHCLAEGIAVPERLALAGFNGLDLGQALPIPLTTVASRRAEIGAAAAGMLMDRRRARSAAGAGADGPRKLDVGFALVPGATA